MKRNYKDQIYMFDGDKDSVYLSNVVTDPDLQVGEHTYYNDYVNDPRDFQKNNLLYHHPEAYHDKIVIGKYCSLACGASFVCPSGFHSSKSFSTYPFGLAFGYWDLPDEEVEKLLPDLVMGNVDAFFEKGFRAKERVEKQI